jgi:Fe-S oxidoreductase/nitrate reductase gamma subunit
MALKQIIFIVFALAAFGLFGYTVRTILSRFKLTKQKDHFDRSGNIGKRISTTLLVAFGQSKMFKRPVAGILHALVWWGFLVITIGTVEMILDGFLGTDRILGILGGFYDFVTASGEIFAGIIIISCIIFLFRRYVTKPARFTAREMKPKSRMDATFILSMILLLMFSLLGMNLGYVELNQNQDHFVGYYPISQALTAMTASWSENSLHLFEQTNWWIHIGLVLTFLNILPYSKHFHVFMAVPNVYFSRLTPAGQLHNMPEITKEVRSFMDLDPPSDTPEEESEVKRFGVKDVEDITWKNLMDSYTCTECGRCTASCPANITGKLLSPRKLYIDLRARMTEKAPHLIENPQYSDGKALVGDWITEEELWACTTCGACMEECPVDIEHVPFIVDMRRYLVLEESKAPESLNIMFNNIQNNGAPWAMSSSARFDWAEGLEIPTVADLAANNEVPEVLFWVGCAGSFDDRYKRVTRAFAQILIETNTKFAVLGMEESCTGDPARRAGNEMVFQMQALMNIQTLNGYGIKKIVTACPHCFNTLKNEYPELGGNYEVIHHSTYLQELIDGGKVRISGGGEFKGKKITFHDSCYLGRANDIYEAPRNVLEKLDADLVEMKRCKTKGLCCGAGGGQMFKDAEPGNRDVNIERTEEALATGAEVIAAACPFCMTMMSDGVKHFEQEEKVKVYDLAEIVVMSKG